MAASPRLAARPVAHISRSALVAIAVAGLVVLSLAFIHPLVELFIFALAPGLVALAFADGFRQHFRRFASVAALSSGLTGGAWLILTADPGENVPALLIGAMVSTLLIGALAYLGSWTIDRVLTRRAAWR